MRVVIIGSGNVATILGQKILQASHEIMQVWSRNNTHASELARMLNAAPTEDLSRLADADLYIIAVSDAAVAAVSKQLSVTDRVVVHTAGSVSIHALDDCSNHTGVLYPLQSIRKERDAGIPIPLLIDGNNDHSLRVIQELARSLSHDVRIVQDEPRLKLHVAAVVLNNFLNHLYTLTTDYCNKMDLDFQLLMPLITETAERLEFIRPHDAQTGPAVRNDYTTIDKHLALLKDDKDLYELYKLFSEKIGAYYARS